MPAFKKFGPGDQVDNVLVLEPQYSLASGTAGWRGSPNGGSSIALYGGFRRSSAGVVQDIRYQSTYPNPGQFGQYVRDLPLTATLNVVWMTNETLTLNTQVGSTRWGEEHWDTVMRLYQDYSSRDPDFVTASYDYYSLFAVSSSTNLVQFDRTDRTTALPQYLTASFAIEAWIKPFVTGSASRSYTISAQNESYWFGITGSSGHLAFSGSLGVVATSSLDLIPGRWHHVAFSYDSTTKTGSFFVDLTFGGNLLSPSASLAGGNTADVTYLSYGNQVDPTTEPAQGGGGFSSTQGLAGTAFHGMLGEFRLWDSARTWAQLSSSAGMRLTGSQQAGPALLAQLSEGPQAGPIGSFVSTVYGSGVLNYAEAARYPTSSFTWGFLNGFNDRSGPVWLPNDNVSFYPTKQLWTGSLSGSWGNSISANLSRMLVIDVPSAFYGRQIQPGSVRLEDRSWSAANRGLVRVLVDDGRGNLYVSGSMFSSSLATKEDYAGVGWNKVGNVFYSEGLITIKDPSLFDFGRIDGSTAHPNDTLQVNFRGHSRVPVKTLMCRLDHGEFNATTNPTFWYEDDNGERLRRHTSGSIRVSTIGIYNSDRELVAVARLADPVRKRDRDRLNIRLRMDF